MKSKHVIVPVDFTPASDQALKQAEIIARKSGCSIRLIHVLNSATVRKNQQESSSELENLIRMAKEVREQNLECDYILAEGSIFDAIPAYANKPECCMMAIGTHGIKGIKQKLSGADMLKIVRKVMVPSLVVQDDCICRDFNPIVFPVGSHDGFVHLAEATAGIAELFGSEIHLYSVNRPGNPVSEQVRHNASDAEQLFAEKKIPFKRVREESNGNSVGFARQTLEYAEQNKAGLLSMMSVKSDEHYYIANADKESMINNAFNIPVLCLNGKEESD